MDMSDYVLGLIANDRLARARDEARRRALVVRPRRQPLRARLGMALIALGQRLLTAPAPHRVGP